MILDYCDSTMGSTFNATGPLPRRGAWYAVPRRRRPCRSATLTDIRLLAGGGVRPVGPSRYCGMACLSERAAATLASHLARCDRQDGGLCGGRRSAYHFGFSDELTMRFTRDWDIRKVRAMAAGLTPALNDARMRFAVPAGILSIPLTFLLRMAADWPCGDAPVGAAAAVSFLGPP